MNRGLISALSSSVAIALLAGCGGSEPPIAAHGSMAQGSVGNSWMDAGASKWDLLYVTSGGGINVYRYWHHKLIGKLGGFISPQGECVDAAGDIYVTDYGAMKVFEFTHGGKQPVNVIDVAPYQPEGCAVDFKSGDLAVANETKESSSYGSLAIYSDAQGSPRLYTAPLNHYESCAYDDKGNLLVTDGTDSDSYYGSNFAWLAKNTQQLVTIRLHGGSEFGVFNEVHGIAWDGKYWVINGFEGGLISQVRVKRHRGRLAGQSYIQGGAEALGPIAIYNDGKGSQGSQAVAASFTDDEVSYWKYPSGGQRVAEIVTGLSEPYGVAISLKQKASR